MAERLGCKAQDFERDGVVFAANDGQRAPFLEICTMGRAVIVSSSRELLPRIQELLMGKSRDEIFECPFVYGQSIYYIPDFCEEAAAPLPRDYVCKMLCGDQVQELAGLTGFENALTFDEAGNTPTGIVFYAMRNGKIAGLAGASQEAGRLWELGVDVKSAHRNSGLAMALVSGLAAELMRRGDVPFYCASVTNIASQAVAHRCGLRSYWVSTYRTMLDGSSAYADIVGKLCL